MINARNPGYTYDLNICMPGEARVNETQEIFSLTLNPYISLIILILIL